MPLKAQQPNRVKQMAWIGNVMCQGCGLLVAICIQEPRPCLSMLAAQQEAMYALYVHAFEGRQLFSPFS